MVQFDLRSAISINNYGLNGSLQPVGIMCLSWLFALMCGWIYAELDLKCAWKELILLMKIIASRIKYGEQLHLNCAIVQQARIWWSAVRSIDSNHSNNIFNWIDRHSIYWIDVVLACGHLLADWLGIMYIFGLLYFDFKSECVNRIFLNFISLKCRLDTLCVDLSSGFIRKHLLFFLLIFTLWLCSSLPYYWFCFDSLNSICCLKRSIMTFAYIFTDWQFDYKFPLYRNFNER